MGEGGAARAVEVTAACPGSYMEKTQEGPPPPHH